MVGLSPAFPVSSDVMHHPSLLVLQGSYLLGDPSQTILFELFMPTLGESVSTCIPLLVYYVPVPI